MLPTYSVVGDLPDERISSFRGSDYSLLFELSKSLVRSGTVTTKNIGHLRGRETRPSQHFEYGLLTVDFLEEARILVSFPRHYRPFRVRRLINPYSSRTKHLHSILRYVDWILYRDYGRTGAASDQTVKY